MCIFFHFYTEHKTILSTSCFRHQATIYLAGLSMSRIALYKAQYPKAMLAEVTSYPLIQQQTPFVMMVHMDTLQEIYITLPEPLP
jgi:hypothetical protein